MKHRISYLVLAAILFLYVAASESADLASSVTGPTEAKPSEPATARIDDLDRRLITPLYHVYYTIDGDNAFGTPGNVEHGHYKAERLVEQFERGRRFYEITLGLDFLLGRGRFADIPQIDVRVAALPRRIMGNAGGGRFEVNRNPRFYGEDSPAPKNLRMNISTLWREGNLTPEHEVFHLFQYGYSFIANTWYLEGLTGSLAPAFAAPRAHTYRTAKLPQTKEELHALLTLPNGLAPAWGCWGRLMAHCEDSCPIAWGEQEKFTIQDERPICSSKFVNGFMSALRDNSSTVTALRGGAAYDPWTQPRRKPGDNAPTERGRFENNYWLLKSVSQAMDSSCQYRDDSELVEFKRLIDGLGDSEQGFMRAMTPQETTPTPSDMEKS